MYNIPLKHLTIFFNNVFLPPFLILIFRGKPGYTHIIFLLIIPFINIVYQHQCISNVRCTWHDICDCCVHRKCGGIAIFTDHKKICGKKCSCVDLEWIHRVHIKRPVYCTYTKGGLILKIYVYIIMCACVRACVVCVCITGIKKKSGV